MKTITIEDPREVRGILDAEFPKATYTNASYCAFSEGNQWHVSVYQSSPRMDISAVGKTAEVALAQIRQKASEFDPMSILREQAKAAGMKLVPA